jgi:hypothetical protein
MLNVVSWVRASAYHRMACLALLVVISWRTLYMFSWSVGTALKERYYKRIDCWTPYHGRPLLEPVYVPAFRLLGKKVKTHHPHMPMMYLVC